MKPYSSNECINADVDRWEVIPRRDQPIGFLWLLIVSSVIVSSVIVSSVMYSDRGDRKIFARF